VYLLYEKKRRWWLTYSGRWSSSLEKHHVNRNNIAFSFQPGLDEVELGGAEPSDRFNALEEILHGGVIIKLGSMARSPNGLDDHPPGASLGVEGPVVCIGGSEPFVKHHADIHPSEDLGLGELLGAVMAADFLVGGEGEVDRAEGAEVSGLEAAEGFEVLHADALHVLRAAGEDAAVGVEVGAEGVVVPLGVLGGNDVGVGVEEDGGKVGVCALPFEKNQRLPFHKLYALGFQGKLFPFRYQKLCCFLVTRVWLCSVDFQVLLES